MTENRNEKMEKFTTGSLRELGVDGKIGFSIRDMDTPEVQEIHDRFKDFCKQRCFNNYTLGLKLLLTNFEGGEHFNFYRKIEELEAKIEKLEGEEESEPAPITVDEVEGDGTF